MKITKESEIGAIFEIPAERGLSYAQLTHRHPTHTDVLRIFKRKYKSRPENISLVINDEVELTVLCAVKSANKSNVLPKVGTAPIRDDLKDFPVFRSAANGPNLELGTWWIWDGKNETKIGDVLTDEQKQLPRLMILNVAAIVDRIEGKVHPALL